jgi:hypothetical protein
MKGSKSLIAISVAVTLALIPSAIAAPKTTVKAAGRVTTTVVNTILNGVGAPSKTLGINGDFYIDTKNLVLYGPKINGSWKNSSSLKQAEAKSVATVIGEGGAVGDKGAQGDKGDKGATGNTGATGAAGLSGAVGPAGSKGNDGATGAMGASGATGAMGASGATGSIGATGATGASGSNGSNGATGATGASGSTGATGSRGDTGLTGSTGATGAQGVKGDAGTAGLDGATGAQGIQGIKGDAGTAGAAGTAGVDGANGVQGIQGIKGDAGTTGTQGIQGIQGDVGTTGAAGISASYFIDLGSWSLGTNKSLGPSDSNIFANLTAGSYTFEIMADGTFSPATTVAMAIGMQVIASAGVLDFWVFASDTFAYINYDGSRHYQFMIIGKFVCTGAATLKMRAIDQSGTTSGNLLTFNGRALINKVGSIG